MGTLPSAFPVLFLVSGSQPCIVCVEKDWGALWIPSQTGEQLQGCAALGDGRWGFPRGLAMHVPVGGGLCSLGMWPPTQPWAHLTETWVCVIPWSNFLEGKAVN